MELRRCKDQSRQSLEEHYAGNEGLGQAMIDLIARLRALPDGRHVYGLTSHYHLCLLAEDTSYSPRSVIVIALDKRNYTIEYLMPERLAPWPSAYVRGEARSEDDAVSMILQAMELSEGWAEPRLP